MEGVLMLVSLIAGIVLTNLGFSLFMKVLGANVMFFSIKGKLIAILVVSALVYNLLTRGIS